MTDDEIEAAKRRAARSATAAVEDGMTVGLGTGSTAAHAIRRLGERVDAGLNVDGIPTSFGARELAQEAGIPLTTIGATDPDVAIDGADQVADGQLVKGGGAAHAREKVVDTAADRLLVVVDPRKEADVLDEPVPVEVLPAARRPAARALEQRGGDPTLRVARQKDGPVVTDNGNLVLDCAFGPIEDPGDVATSLSTIPGVVAHGLFVDCADEIHVGSADGVRVRSYCRP